MRIRWRGLELPNRVVSDRGTLTDTYGKFSVEPFHIREINMRIRDVPCSQKHRPVTPEFVELRPIAVAQEQHAVVDQLAKSVAFPLAHAAPPSQAPTANGAQDDSPGQRPGFIDRKQIQPCKGETYPANARREPHAKIVPPFQGLGNSWGRGPRASLRFALG